jgi:hypothetical protein
MLMEQEDRVALLEEGHRTLLGTVYKIVHQVLPKNEKPCGFNEKKVMLYEV